MSKITDQDVATLAQQDMRTLARWWCVLNQWQWPDGLPDPKPKPYVSDGRRSQIMWWIDDAIGHRECLREWNRSRMDDEAFNDFWRGNFEGHGPSKQRNENRAKELAAEANRAKP